MVTDSEGGVLIDSSFGNQVIGNTVHGMSDDAVDLEESHRTVVLGNDLRFNAGGVELLDSTDNRVEGNLTSDSAGTGIAVEGVAHRNAIVKNVSNDNDSFGITVIGVTLPEDGNLLYKNETNGNGGGGINVSVAGHTLRANEARGNAGWGIYAGTGTIDGGFNMALGNSESGQCFGVVCLPVGAPPLDIVPPDTTITDAPRTVTVAGVGHVRVLGRRQRVRRPLRVLARRRRSSSAAHRRNGSPACPTVSTRSPCGRSTSTATSTRHRPSTSGRSRASPPSTVAPR